MAKRKATDEQIKENARQRSLRWRLKNKDRVNEAAKAWQRRNPEKTRESRRKSREKNKEKYAAARRTQRSVYAANSKRWRKRHIHKVRQKQREVRDTTQSVLNAIKMASGCVDCGFRKHPVALHFDHVRGVKVKDVARIYSLPVALKEIEKCEVRCANCHHIRHYVNHPRRQREAATRQEHRGTS